jgi:hypothetical protein
MLCNGALTRQLNMNPEKTNYITAGPDGQRKLAQGPDLPSYRGLSIVNTRQFSLEVGSAPRDMLRCRVRVSEHYHIPWEVNNMRKRFEFYDQSRESMFYLSWTDLWRASLPDSEANASSFEKEESSAYKALPAFVPKYNGLLVAEILERNVTREHVYLSGNHFRRAAGNLETNRPQWRVCTISPGHRDRLLDGRM